MATKNFTTSRKLLLFLFTLIGGIAIGLMLNGHLMSPEKIKRIKAMVGIKESPTEKLRTYVEKQINSTYPLVFKNEKLMPNGDFCGQVGIQNPLEKSIQFNRFIVSPGNFVDVGDLGIVALDNSQWKTYAATQEKVIKIVGANAKDYNRALLLKRWERHCGEPIPIEEIASGFREEVKAALKDPGSAQFRNEKVIEAGKYCGEVNAKNSYGGYVGFRRFYMIMGGILQIEDSKAIPLAKEGSSIWVTVTKRMEEQRQEFGSDSDQAKAFDKEIFNRMWSSTCGES